MTYVVDHDEERSAEACGEDGTRPDGPVHEDARGHSGSFLLPDLDGEEAGDQNAKNDKEGNDASIVPRVPRTTPLKRQQQGDDARDEEQSAFQIKGQKLLSKGQLLLGDLWCGELQEQNNEDAGDGTEGEVDVEAPAPADLVGKGTAHERASHGGDAVHGTDETHVHGALAKGHAAVDNEKSARKDTGRAETSNGAADDET